MVLKIRSRQHKINNITSHHDKQSIIGGLRQVQKVAAKNATPLTIHAYLKP